MTTLRDVAWQALADRCATDPATAKRLVLVSPADLDAVLDDVYEHMRQPSEAMNRAGRRSRCLHSGSVADIWRAMLAAAFEDGA